MDEFVMAIFFDDTNDYIAIPSTATLPSGDNAHTILVRFRLSSGTLGYIYGQNLGSTGDEVKIHISGTGGTTVTYDNANLSLQATGLSLDDNKWHTLMVRHRPSPRSKQIWVDGVLKASTSSHTLSIGNSAGRNIGANQANPPTGSFFGGWMDDFRIFASKYINGDDYLLYHAGSRLPIGGEDVWYSMDTAQGISGWDGQTLSTSNVLPNLKGDGKDGIPTNSPTAAASAAQRK